MVSTLTQHLLCWVRAHTFFWVFICRAADPRLKPSVLDETSSFAQRFGLAYCVTIFAMQMSYPFDTLRRRMMLTSGTGRHYPSSFHCLKEICECLLPNLSIKLSLNLVKYEGKSALLSGSTADILRGTGGALILAGFDHLKTVYLKWKFMIDPGESQKRTRMNSR